MLFRTTTAPRAPVLDYRCLPRTRGSAVRAAAGPAAASLALFAALVIACSTTTGDDAPSADDVRIAMNGEGRKASRAGAEAEVETPLPSVPSDMAPGLRPAPDDTPPIPTASCEVDAECVRIERGCCPLGRYVAVHKDKVAAYQESLGCDAPHACPLILAVDDHSMAECNWDTRACELVKPENIGCNAFSPNPHACPDGFRCVLPEHVMDAPGRCFQPCGGFAGTACEDANALCVDDPSDDCDPNRGGADCGGLCIGR